MGSVHTGTYTGTGSAVNVNMGFTPTRLNIYDEFHGLIGWWDDSMTDGYVHVMNPYLETLINDPNPTIGGTKTNIYTGAFDYKIAGVEYTKAAVAAGTAPAATTVPQNTYGLFGLEIASDGTLDNGADAADNATGYASEALAIAALPSASADHIIVCYITVMSTDAGGFIGATTELDDSAVTVNYYTPKPNLVLTNGITPKGTAAADTIRGVQVGTSTYINKAGATYYYEAYRD